MLFSSWFRDHGESGGGHYYLRCPMAQPNGSGKYDSSLLKVPKCEIFDRTDFHDFYTIKSLWGGDFGVKKKKILKYLGAHLGPRNSLRSGGFF